MLIRIGDARRLTDGIMAVLRRISHGVRLGNQQTVLIGIQHSISAPFFFACGHGRRVVGIDRHRAAKVGVPDDLVPGVVSKGLLRNFTVRFRITDFDDVSCRIVGDVGRVSVFVGDFRRLDEAVIDLDDGIASRVGLFYDVEPLVISISLGIAVFIRMADQKPVLIENADALMAAAVGGDSLSVAFIYEDGRNGAGNAVSLADDPAACVIGIVKIADVLGIGAGLDSVFVVIDVAQGVAVYIADAGEKVAAVCECDLSFGVVIDLENFAVGVLLQIYLFAGDRVRDGNERIRISEQGFKALMIDDFGKLAVGVVIFRAFRIAVKSIRIRLCCVYLQNISVFVRCGAGKGRAVLRIVFGVYGGAAVYTDFGAGNFHTLFIVVIPARAERAAQKLRGVVADGQLQRLSAEERHNRVFNEMGAAVYVNGIGNRTAVDLVFGFFLLGFLCRCLLYRYRAGGAYAAAVQRGGRDDGRAAVVLCAYKTGGAHACDAVIAAGPSDGAIGRVFGANGSREEIGLAFVQCQARRIQCNRAYRYGAGYGNGTVSFFFAAVCCRSVNGCRTDLLCLHKAACVVDASDAGIAAAPYDIAIGRIFRANGGV